MAREKGIFGVSNNYEIQKAAPMDARMLVATTADLIDPDIWSALDENEYTYVGMIVNVSSGVDAGLYRLIDTDYTDAANWVKINKQPIVTIASNYATDIQKSTADYVCDGTADEVQINAAIQAMPIKVGGKIQLIGGLFNINAPILIDRRVSIQGEGSGLCHADDAIITEGATTLRATANIDIIQVNSTGVNNGQTEGFAIRDILFQGYGKTTSGNSGIHFITRTDVCLLENLNFMDCYICLIMTDVDAINIIACSFQWSGLGIYMNKVGVVATVAVNITACTFADCVGIETYDSKLINCGGIAIAEAYYVMIQGCRFARCDGQGTAKSAISLLNTSLIQISNNQFWGMKGNCISLLGIFDGVNIVSTCKFTQISGNQFQDYGTATNADNLRNGVYIKGANITLISNNMFIQPSAFSGTPTLQPLYAVYEEDNMVSWYGYTKILNNFCYNLHGVTADKMKIENANSESVGNIIETL